MDGMDLHSQLLLDISNFNKQLNTAVRRHQKAMARMGQATGKAGKQGAVIAAKEQAHLKKTSKAVDKNTASWWKRFGAVALGFTIAYRAMNAFENGLTRVILLIGDSIRVSGELASVQAKLAFWYQLHSKQMGNFEELYARAGVNTMALMKANLGAISTFEELATGIDEVAQTIGGIGPEWIEHLASVVDFTKLVAQTTGSTTRQIRQELQALMQGQIKTTDVMVRSLVRVGILTKSDIKDLKAMTRQTEIFHHILTEIHGRWREVADVIISTNVTIAMQKWEDHLKFMLIMGTEIASKYEGVGNIFAQVFVDHMKEIRKNMTHKDWTNIVLFIQNLAKGLDFLLRVFERTLYVIINVVASMGSFSKSISKTFQLIKYAAVIMIVYKSFSLLAKIVTLTITKFITLIGLIGTKAVWSVMTLDKSIKLLASRFFAIVTAIAAVGVAMKSLYDYVQDREGDIARVRAKYYHVHMQDIMKLHDAGKITNKEFMEWHHVIKEIAKEEVGGKSFADHFSENIDNALDSIVVSLKEKWKDFWDWAIEEPDIDKKKLAKVQKDLQDLMDGLMKGLTSIADPKMEFSEKNIENYEKALASLIDKYEAYSQTIIALKTGELWRKDSKAIKDFQSNIIELGKIEREHITLEKEVGEKRAQIWLDFTLLMRDARSEYDKLIRNTRMMEELQDSLSELTGTAYEHKKRMLQIEVENMRKTEGVTKKLKKAIDEYYKYRMLQIERDFNSMNEMAERTADAMESAFSDLFFDVITGDFEDLEDLITRVLRNVQRILSDVLAQMLRAKLIGEQLGTGQWTGGWLTNGGGSAGPPVAAGSGYVPSYHTGGIAGITHPRVQVPDWFSTFAPRLHNGLRSDEYPAILQAGERVIPRGGRDEDKVNIQINNYTGAETQVKEDRNPYGGRDITVIIGESLGKDVSQGGPLHQSMRRTFGLKPVTAGR